VRTLYITLVICNTARDQGLGLSPGPVVAQTIPICNLNTIYPTYISSNTRWRVAWPLLAKSFPDPEVTGSTPVNKKVLTIHQVTHGAQRLGHVNKPLATNGHVSKNHSTRPANQHLPRHHLTRYRMVYTAVESIFVLPQTILFSSLFAIFPSLYPIFLIE
jgi:hypothetical protein